MVVDVWSADQDIKLLVSRIRSTLSSLRQLRSQLQTLATDIADLEQLLQDRQPQVSLKELFLPAELRALQPYTTSSRRNLVRAQLEKSRFSELYNIEGSALAAESGNHTLQQKHVTTALCESKGVTKSYATVLARCRPFAERRKEAIIRKNRNTNEPPKWTIKDLQQGLHDLIASATVGHTPVRTCNLVAT